MKGVNEPALFSIGSYIPLCTKSGSPLYAAHIRRTIGRKAQLEWFECNDYGHSDKWAPASQTFELPVEACMRAITQAQLDMGVGLKVKPLLPKAHSKYYSDLPLVRSDFVACISS